MGWQELLLVLILAAIYFGPIAVVGYVARRNDRSLHFIWWPAVLGWIGAVIALIIVLTGRRGAGAGR